MGFGNMLHVDKSVILLSRTLRCSLTTEIQVQFDEILPKPVAEFVNILVLQRFILGIS